MKEASSACFHTPDPGNAGVGTKMDYVRNDLGYDC
jgi:hypothetical protein